MKTVIAKNEGRCLRIFAGWGNTAFLGKWLLWENRV